MVLEVNSGEWNTHGVELCLILYYLRPSSVCLCGLKEVYTQKNDFYSQMKPNRIISLCVKISKNAMQQGALE